MARINSGCTTHFFFSLLYSPVSRFSLLSSPEGLATLCLSPLYRVGEQTPERSVVVGHAPLLARTATGKHDYLEAPFHGHIALDVALVLRKRARSPELDLAAREERCEHSPQVKGIGCALTTEETVDVVN